jgi:hypothetical protein
MSKGDKDRTGDKDAFDKGYDKAFPGKKPWWERRDERKAKEAQEKK